MLSLMIIYALTPYIENSLLSKINESIEWIKFGKIGNDQARNMTKD